MDNATKQGSPSKSELIEALSGKPPNPGSDAAVAMGCTCPRMDNGYGCINGGNGPFWITKHCPIHDAT